MTTRFHHGKTCFKIILISILQALEAEMVPYLLDILEGKLETIENLATTKAQIVKALKAMTTSFLLGETVNAILEKSAVWAEYKDQRHDLFISNTSTSCYLTGKKTQICILFNQFHTLIIVCQVRRNATSASALTPDNKNGKKINRKHVG